MSLLKLKNFQTPITLASNSWGLTSIGNELFIGDYTTKDILVYDLNTNTLLRTLVNNGFTNARALGTDGTNLYMANSTMKIMRINKEDGTIIETKTDVTFSMSNSMTFFIDIINDIIYHCDYASTLYIKKYSDGSLIKSYDLGVSAVSSVTLINDNLVVGAYAATSKLYISSKISKGLTNLTFEQVNLTFTKLCGIAYYNNKTYFSTYTNNNIASLDVYYCLGNEVSNVSSVINKGDYIPCRYTASATGQVGFFSELGNTSAAPIPMTSSATPNGSFNLIYAGKDFLGRKKFIADRNLQHSISWDTLNSAGITSELPLKYGWNLIPTMTSDTSIVGTVIYHNQYNTTYAGYKAFDRDINTTNNGWFTTVLSGAYIGFDFTNKKQIQKYTLCPRPLISDVGSDMPKEWDFEAWDEVSSSWVILHSIRVADNIGSWTAQVRKEFIFSNLNKYNKYRINIITPSTTSIGIGEIEMMEKISPNNTNLSIRLLTGGTSATDTDNEWDKIIVNSNLGGTITAGDDNVWNWSGLRTMTSSTLVGYPANRVDRGLSSVSNLISYSTGTPGTGLGFRPVLLVEELTASPVINSLDKSILDNGLRLSMQTNISHQSNQNVKYKVSIKKPDDSVSIKRDYDTNFVAPSISSLEFNKDDFDLGVNVVTVEVVDENNHLVTSTINITKTKTIKTLILDGEKVKHINNNNLELLDSSYSTITEPDLETLFLANGMGEDISLNQGFKSQVENTLKLLVFNTNLLS